MKVRLAFLPALAIICLPAMANAAPSHGIAMHGKPLYARDFKHFSYTNPDAPKGGRVVLGRMGSFDSLNPLIVRGSPAPGLRGYVFESLMARSYDEPFSLYGLLAETIDTPDDRSWVTFKVRKEARFSDGKPVTVDDVIFSHALLRDKGRPNHRFYYSKISQVEKIAPDTVKFIFKAEGDREMPLIMGLMPILPRHAFKRDSFEQTTLKPVIGSGPYLIAKVEPGKSLTYARNKAYWGRMLSVNRGRFNFGEISYEFYRDNNALFEAFKKGLNHVRFEGDPSRWALAYDFPAIRDGKIKKQAFALQIPSGMAALVFNTRRPKFQNQDVRRALTLMYDFEWINKNLFHGLYKRTTSFFERSNLASTGHKADARELKLLASYMAAIQPELLDGSYRPPTSNGSGRDRTNRRLALRLLKKAGYVLKGAKLIEKSSGKLFTFEMLAASRSQERMLLNFASSLRRIGVTATIRQVDSAQYQQRKKSYDFDMIQNNWFASLSPGNEQNFRWNSKSADTEGTFNYPGVKSAAVDAMIKAILAASDRPAFVSAVRALDRSLLSGNYVIPLFHLPNQWISYWAHLQHPDKVSLYGVRFDTWWTK